MVFVRSIGPRRWSRRREKSFTLLLLGHETAGDRKRWRYHRRSVIGSICDLVFCEIDWSLQPKNRG